MDGRSKPLSLNPIVTIVLQLKEHRTREEVEAWIEKALTAGCLSVDDSDAVAHPMFANLESVRVRTVDYD
jgi:hypothetical protein